MTKSPEEQKFFDNMWAFWTPKGAEVPPCIRCYAKAVTLHEVKPKSTYRDWMEDPFNSVPVCASCHEWAQADTTTSGTALYPLVVSRLHQIKDWKPSRVIREL